MLADVDGVYVWRVRGERYLHAAGEGAIAEFLEDPRCKPGLSVFYDRVEGLNPLPDFLEFIDVLRANDRRYRHNFEAFR